MSNKAFFLAYFYLSIFLISLGLQMVVFLPYIGIYLLAAVVHYFSGADSTANKVTSWVVFAYTLTLPFVSAYAWYQMMGWPTAVIYLILSLIGYAFLAKNIGKEVAEDKKKGTKLSEKLEIEAVLSDDTKKMDFERYVKLKFGNTIVCKPVLYTPDELKMLLDNLEWRAEVRNVEGKVLAWVGFDNIEGDYMMVILHNK